MPKTTGWRDALERTRRTAFGRIAALAGASQLTPAFWEELEGELLQADLGPALTADVTQVLRDTAAREGILTRENARAALRSQLSARLPVTETPSFIRQPDVILIVGVNGSGKTTTIAKLAHRFSAEGKRVLLAAADTFRAAAADQLSIWAGRLDLEIVAGQPGADPGAVAYDAAQAAVARTADILLVDTAGRLHTRYNLMEELKKVHRVLGKAIPGAPHHTWLVLDAATGQNAIAQAAAFHAAVHADGIILAKLDGSAKGGMVFRIRSELNLPVLFAGLGENPDDLVCFDPDSFLDGVLA